MNHFIKKFNEKYKLKKRVDEREIKALMNYEWPGNVRELENLIERLVVTYPGDTIRHINLNDMEAAVSDEMNYELFAGCKLKTAIEKLEKYMTPWKPWAPPARLRWSWASASRPSCARPPNIKFRSGTDNKKKDPGPCA